MSRENVERIRQAVDEINRGDLEAAFARAHPDLEWQTLDLFPDAETYHGPEGAAEFFQTWRETFPNLRLHLEDCVPAGEDRVIAALRVSGEGAESGVEVESPTFFQVLEFRGERLIRGRMFGTRSEALEAAGLRE
jgi:ketosteroid isomerase-like protein